MTEPAVHYDGRGGVSYLLWLPLFLLSVHLCGASAQEAAKQPYSSVLRQSPELVETLTSDILEQCQRLVNGKKYGEAVPYLNELAYRYRYGEENRQQRTVLEWAYFYLALGLIELERFDQAADVLNEYVKRFPQGRWFRPAMLMLADTHCSEGEWAEAEAVLLQLLRDHGLEPNQAIAARRLLGEAYIKQQKWEAALEPLQYIFQKSMDVEIRSKAAVLITTCYVRLDRMSDLYKFLPMVQRGSPQARYDIEFNVAMIEAGDRNFHKQDYIGALVCYRQVHFKQELLSFCDLEVQRLKSRHEEMLRHGLAKPENLTRLRRELSSLAREKAMLEEIEEYDQQVVIRQARAYLELKRHWEALVLFRSVFERFPKHELADQALYSAFAVAAEMDEEEHALRAGHKYLESFPDGEFFEEITLMMAQLHVKNEQYREAVAIVEKALEKKPDHMYYEQLCYLEGYSLFQNEEFARCLEVFSKLRDRSPEGEFREAADYWHAMAQLYSKSYEQARNEFSDFVLRYIEGSYFEDAFFRLGVVQYALEQYDESAETFVKFVNRFPLSHLKAEAFVMLGDIAAGKADLDVALDYYGKVWGATDNIIYIDYATHRAGKVLELESRWEDMIRHYDQYLARFGHRGRFTEAVYWKGFAQMRLGKTLEALNGFLTAVVKWGDTPEHFGADMIVRDLIEHVKNSIGPEDRARFIQRLKNETDLARVSRKTTLHLRLLAALVDLTEAEDERMGMIVPLLNEQTISDSAPVTLLLIAREALARNQKDLARLAYAQLLTKYRKSDLVLDALKSAGDLAVDEKRYDEAQTYFEEVAQRFATMPDAGYARKRLGDAYRLQGKCQEAIKEYNTVLSVKDWKGPLWPESLFNIGICHMDKREVREAFAYFQRVYVLYTAFPDWAAKAYLRSGECLQLLNRRFDAIKTYEEMLKNEAIAEQPEAAEARRQLARLTNM
ncbi:MAG: tetratricopeptide repeat protein [Kiritimatiellae bacterium]|nr:tetratricopeptide repeat protein [Kiritimatiellia bacterium]